MNKKQTVVLLIITVVFVVAAVLFSNNKESSPEYPEIEFDGSKLSVPVEATDEELLKGVSATDPEDGDVTSSLVVEGVSNLIEGNEIKVSYVAFDSENHVTKAERKVEFVDYESPHFTLSEPLIFKSSNSINVMSRIGAEDVFEGDISRNVKYSIVTNGIDIEAEGEYEILLSVTNKIGDTVTLPVTVEITEKEPNTASIKLTDYMIYLERGSEFNAKDYLESYMINGTKYTATSKIKITSDVDVDEPGVYTVDYTYGSKGESQTRLVVVVE